MKATTSPIYRWRVGEVEITRVLEFEAALFEPAVIHPEASPEIIERHRSWLTPTLMDPIGGLMIFAFHSTIIKTPRATILVDTCSGNDKERPHKLRYHRKNWPYLANLAAAGFVPEGIDYVLCTHLHADHVGWNTRLLDGRWVPTFPNARYLFARQEWEHWRVAEWEARFTYRDGWDGLDGVAAFLDAASQFASGNPSRADRVCHSERVLLGHHPSHDGRVGARASTLHCAVARLQHGHGDPWRVDANGRRVHDQAKPIRPFPGLPADGCGCGFIYRGHRSQRDIQNVVAGHCCGAR